MRKELTFAELDSERVELLPARETLTLTGSSLTGSSNWSAIFASNSSLAANVASYNATASSAAVQTIAVSQTG